MAAAGELATAAIFRCVRTAAASLTVAAAGGMAMAAIRGGVRVAGEVSAEAAACLRAQ